MKRRDNFEKILECPRCGSKNIERGKVGVFADGKNIKIRVWFWILGN